MAIIHLTEASSGAPTLNGVNGSLNAILKWALVTNASWTNPFTATNADIFKAPSGNGFSLFVNHDSAVSGDARLALVRGCESATAASTAGIVNPFPTVAQLANSVANWLTSSTAAATARNFDIFISPSAFILFTNGSSVANTWDMQIFGDMSPVIAADTWCTLCTSRNSATFGVGGATSFPATVTSSGSFLNTLYFCRSIDGTVNSTHSGYVFTGTSNLGVYIQYATMQNGPSALIDRKKLVVGCSGSSTITVAPAKGLFERAYVPQLWEPIHSGSGAVNTRDTWTDTAYNGSAIFEQFMGAAAGTSGQVIVETTATWNPPAA